MVHIFAMVICLADVALANGASRPDPRLSFSGVAGQLTANGISDVFKAADINFTYSGFAGMILACNAPL